MYDHSLMVKSEDFVVQTRYGEAHLMRGYYRDREVYFLARHGRGHAVPPHMVNYRANIAALRRLGVQCVLATAAVGSLREEMPPGTCVVVDQFIDFTRNRPSTFYDGEGAKVIHTDMTEPYCPTLRRILVASGKALALSTVDGGCYVCTEGPRFETPAEIKMFARLGGDLVGMTNVPEVILAREAGLCYAAVALVTNYAAGISPHKLSYEEVISVMEAGKKDLERLLVDAVLRIPENRDCDCAASGRDWPEA